MQTVTTTAVVYWTPNDSSVTVVCTANQLGMQATGPKSTTYQKFWDEMPKPQVQSMGVSGVEYRLVKFSIGGVNVKDLDEAIGETPRFDITFSQRIKAACCVML